MRFLADECLPRAVVEMLRGRGADVIYAAETAHRADDTSLLALATAEQRIVVTEDFDFGDLLIRDLLKGYGAIILFLPDADAIMRAARLKRVLDTPGFVAEGYLTIVSARRVRQRALPVT